jgi:hypothetical protein
MGFEVFVRPVIFPNIRPAATPQPVSPSSSDPTQGWCTIKGASGEVATFSDSWSMSLSKSRAVETRRTSDLARVYQQDDDGTVNKDNFVDVKVPSKIMDKGGQQRSQSVQVDPNQPGQAFADDGYTPLIRISYYKKAQETDNIEIKKRNITDDNPDAPAD